MYWLRCLGLWFWELRSQLTCQVWAPCMLFAFSMKALAAAQEVHLPSQKEVSTMKVANSSSNQTCQIRKDGRMGYCSQRGNACLEVGTLHYLSPAICWVSSVWSALMGQRRNDIRHLRGSIISRCWVLSVYSHDNFLEVGLGVGVCVLKHDRLGCWWVMMRLLKQSFLPIDRAGFFFFFFFFLQTAVLRV